MKLFLSYSSKDKEEVLCLKRMLTENGFSCWMAPYSIPPGSDYGCEIPPAIMECDVFILVLSAASQNSLWVPKEVDFAITNMKPIIPFQIDNKELIDAFNFRLSNIQRIEAYERVAEAYEVLVGRLLAMGEIGGNIKESESDVANSLKMNGNKLQMACPISFNSLPGKEYIFAKETKSQQSYREGPIIVKEDETFWVLETIHNMNQDEESLAENVRLAVDIKKISDKSYIVETVILCDNADPSETKNSIAFESDLPFELDYIMDSAYLYSEYYGLVGEKGIKLSNDIISPDGTTVGFWELDGKIPGGSHNKVTVSVKVKAKIK